MYSYDFGRLHTSLKDLLRKNLKPDAFTWLESQANSITQDKNVSKFNVAFVAMPRKTGKDLIQVSPEEEKTFKELRKN